MADEALIRVGVLACAPYVHTKGIWGLYSQPGDLEDRTRMTGMKLTHVWDLNRGEAEEFARCYSGVEVVDNYYDMVGQVDGIILDDFNSSPHFKELARPYLEAGVPIFINRPFALNLEDAREMIELARKHDTPVMSSSTFEFAPEMEQIKGQVAGSAPLAGYVTANSMSDYPTHGIHGLWFAHACVGGGIRSVSYQTPDWRKPNGVVVIEHEGRDGGVPFYGCVQQVSGTWGFIRVFGKQNFEQLIHPSLYFWLPIVIEMQKMFSTRKMPQSYEALYEKVQLFLAGFKSHIECGGAPVRLDEIGDWRAPLLNPDPYPDGYFG